MSKEAPEVKPFPGVRRVPQSTNWQYWKRNPDTLMNHPAIAGKQWAFRGSLGTSNLREANALAAQKLAELESYWATLRESQRASKPADVTSALQDAIAQRVKVAVLAEDGRLRADPLALAKSLADWWAAHERGRLLAHERAQREAQSESEVPPYRPLPVPRWLSQSGQDELAVYVEAGQGGIPMGDLLALLQERHENAAKQIRHALSRGQSGPFLGLAEREALALGINLGADGWMQPDAKPLRDACQRAYLEALEALAQRDSGAIVDTPLMPVVAPKVAPKGQEVEDGTLRLGAVVGASWLTSC